MSELDLGQSTAAVIAAIGAIGALGTAAFGLVDACKVVPGLISDIGYKHLRAALTPFAPALISAVGDDWNALFLAHWRNGTPKADQKALAATLIQLGLNAETATVLALEGHVDPAAFSAAIVAHAKGETLTDVQVQVISRFRTSVEAKIDAAFVRAEQEYRNKARVIAGLFAVVLAVSGGWLLYLKPEGEPDYWHSTDFGRALLVGLAAVPVAPIAKDLIAALSASVRAVKAAKS